MIRPEEIDEIRAKTAGFWREQVREASFTSIFAGKEIGHRVADYVDETTVEFLETQFDTGHELNSQGNRRPRSMGDVWIKSGGMYNPVNVKAGVYGSFGQPNLVSLTKLIDSLMTRQIDSYYLLFVKTEIGKNELIPHVRIVDMLDYLDFVAFDAGPGQAMLREKKFFDEFSTYSPPQLSVGEKLQKCFDLLQDGDRRLIRNREMKMERMLKQFDQYRKAGGHSINQAGLSIG